MTPKALGKVEQRLSGFLYELLEPMGRSERRHWARKYLEGLLLDGERKSIEPMAARVGADVQALRQFAGQSPWPVEQVQRALARKVVDTLSEPQVWMIDETSFPKAGDASVGVARQYCGTLGKLANCQVAVSLHFSSAQMSCPLSWRLYLPAAWVEDAGRKAAGKIPKQIVHRTKNELALELIDQALEWELPQLPVVADSAYGNDFGFRAALRERALEYAVAVEPSTKVWTSDPNTVGLPPAKGRGRPRHRPAPQTLPPIRDLRQVAMELPTSAWRTINWRQGTKGPLRSRLAKLPVWASHYRPGAHEPPRALEWLLIEWPADADAPSDYWLCQCKGARVALRRLIRLARARWRVELDYRELKEELGLDHYEGRHWLGWHHHVTLVSIAFAFLRCEQVRAKKNFWCELASDTA